MTDNINFRLNNQRLLLTYKGHIDKEDIIEFINKWKPIKNYFVVHENGKEGEYPHTHVLVDFGKAVQSRNQRILDFNDVHPHIKHLNSKKAWYDAISYLKKEDKDAYTNCKDNWVEEVQSYDTLSTALSRFKPSEASGVALAYSLKVSNIHVDKPTFAWFDEWLKLLETVSRRSIIWIHDDVGNSGKTWATKYMMCLDNNSYIVKNFGRRSDFATIIINAINSGWSGKYFIADLPRTMEDHDSIYGCLEDCVDGIVTSTKYSGKTVVFNSPIVTVFSNFLPIESKMSADRWQIYTINNNKSLSNRATNIKKCGA